MNKSLKKAIIPAIASISLTSVLFAGPVQELPASAKSEGQQQLQAEKEKLPLGLPYLKEQRTTESLAPGVTYTRITRGEESEKDFYTVDVDFIETHEKAKALAKKLKSEGFNPRIDRIADRAMDDKEIGPLGYLVRVGAFQTEEAAKELQQQLSVNGYTGLRTVYTGEDGQQTTGPWVLNVLEVDPDTFNGTILPELGKDKVQEKETLTEMAGRNNALAGINGGYFVVGNKDGTPGDLAGISVMDGKLVSEAVNGRSSLILPSANTDADIASVSSSQTAISSDGAAREVDGLNRKPGLIRGCGGTGGDTPTENPKHDYTCIDESELIHFTPVFGNETEAGDGVEAVLNEAGEVIALRTQRGGEIPREGSVLAGTGEAAQWLEAHAQVGMNLQVKNEVTADGKSLSLEQTAGIINGGPRLLENGKISINAAAEGFHWEENPEFYYRFGERRNPRTLAGVKADGTLLFVTVDGRAPGLSVGANFEESARIMKSLGAVDALNLDGGGSTSMTVGNTLVTRPSDQTGERPIADAILLLP
ncbi:phosphodiester glycosidase family protein [Bacillus sp. ISL-47]|uniref:phosphodiester glycosidase family protein n=1 Tax=Bacillus sp. ISL-47 TaxID=2819130 RepID=UPI001BEC9162|nr:phosphodiester glycosidase family protein [Bacillus sp. ISL-47]MBT2690833.1 phosphodiester glycosidase family protein [Bacillus sp. ISL-47]MBT2710811.1 phosphodiester glycosidase family protein [Pseudomonas sp. ISL-84]